MGAKMHRDGLIISLLVRRPIEAGNLGIITLGPVEWNRLQAALGGGFTARNAKLNKTEDQVERLVDALANGTSASAVKDRLRMAEDCRLALVAEGSAAAMELARGLVGSRVLILCVGCGDRI